MLNILICRDLPRPQLHRCSPEQKVFSFQLQHHKCDVVTWRPASACIPTQNPSCAFGRFAIHRDKLCLSLSVKGTGKELKEGLLERSRASAVPPQGTPSMQHNSLVSQYEHCLFLPQCSCSTCLPTFLMIFSNQFLGLPCFSSGFHLYSHSPQLPWRSERHSHFVFEETIAA